VVTIMTLRLIPFLLAALLLAGCSSNPRMAADAGPMPDDVVAGKARPDTVHWGGRIVGVENLRDRTRLEVLAYPLNESGEPIVDAEARGRFIVEQAGFLEPKEYAPQRRIEVRGRLRGLSEGEVGDAPYRFPLVDADQLELWPEAQAADYGRRQPRINFGFGVGSYGSGAGIGIGF
jgi:outer membrane lipoprotein